MKTLSESKEVSFLGSHFRITKYAGSNVVEIEEKYRNKWWRNEEDFYRRVYFGHAEPLFEFARFCETFHVQETSPSTR